MELLSEIEAFVKKEIAAVDSIFEKSESALLTVATHADVILNAVKAWTISPAGATLLSVIEALPVVGQYAEEIVNTILPAAIGAVTTVETDITNSVSVTNIETQISGAVSSILGKTDGDAVASAFNSLQAYITNKIAPLFKVASTIQAALSVAQTVYATGKTA